MIRVRILTENRASEKGTLAEHGLSMLVEADDHKLLFDTGDTSIFAANARALGEDLTAVDSLVLSHGHYDHTGGAVEFCRLNQKARIYINPDAFCERFEAVNSEPIGEHIGIPWNCGAEGIDKERMVFIKEALAVNDKVLLSGRVEIDESGNNKPPIYFVKKLNNNEYAEDPVEDEQFMIIKGKEGAYIFVGCSHPGVLNCVAYAKKLLPDANFRALIGGMHLEGYNTDQLNEIIHGLKSFGIEKVIPLHCTGILASCHIKNSFGENCLLLNVGSEFYLEK